MCKIVLITLAIVIIIITIVSNWLIYEKAGKHGWSCIIPIYNFIVFLQIIGKPWWWILLMIIPFANIVLAIILIHRLSLAFGKGAGFTVGLIILPFIFFPILALGDANYVQS